jgi:large subunit ribosomal protein L21
MKYAILRIKGRQYKVSEGEEIFVDALKDKPEAEVLLTVNEEEVKVGHPLVKNAKVELKVLEQTIKGEKVSVLKYKAKSRYRKRRGFRPLMTKLQVVKMNL